MSAERVAAIEQLGVLDDDPAPELQGMVDLVARLFEVAIAQVNIFTEDEQRQVVAHGMDPAACAIDDSMCGRVREDLGTVVVPDARLDPRFRSSPWVTGGLGRVRFYASAPLVSPDGLPIGRLCVLDESPRDAALVDGVLLETLALVADRVMDLVELRMRNRQLARTLRRLGAAQGELEDSRDRFGVVADQLGRDLHGPLSRVATSLTALAARLGEGPGTASAEELRQVADEATAVAEQADRLVADVLAGSHGARPDGGGGAAGVAGVDLGALVRGAGGELAGTLGAVRLWVGNLPVVPGDPAALRSLVHHLLAAVAGSAAVRGARGVRVRGSREGARAVLEIEHDGRGDSDAPTPGLAASRAVVEALGGRMHEHRPPDGGLTVRVELPGGPVAVE